MRAHLRFVGVIVASVSGCRDAPAARREPPIAQRDVIGASASADVARPGAPPLVPSSVREPPTPAGSASASVERDDVSPETAADPAYQAWLAEQMNDGCKLRRSTNKVESCSAGVLYAPSNWKPSAEDVVTVLRGTSSSAGSESGGCYCASGLAAAARRCATKVGTGAIEMQIGDENDTVDCKLRVEGFKASDGRRFVLLSASNRDQATFYGTLIVHELINGKSEYYVGGFNAITAGLFTLPASDPDADLASPRARSEWPTLPADLKAWLAN